MSIEDLSAGFVNLEKVVTRDETFASDLAGAVQYNADLLNLLVTRVNALEAATAPESAASARRAASRARRAARAAPRDATAHRSAQAARAQRGGAMTAIKRRMPHWAMAPGIALPICFPAADREDPQKRQGQRNRGGGHT